jgi:hypothetical protein
VLEFFDVPEEITASIFKVYEPTLNGIVHPEDRGYTSSKTSEPLTTTQCISPEEGQ